MRAEGFGKHTFGYECLLRARNEIAACRVTTDDPERYWQEHAAVRLLHLKTIEAALAVVGTPRGAYLCRMLPATTSTRVGSGVCFKPGCTSSTCTGRLRQPATRNAAAGTIIRPDNAVPISLPALKRTVMNMVVVRNLMCIGDPGPFCKAVAVELDKEPLFVAMVRPGLTMEMLCSRAFDEAMAARPGAKSVSFEVKELTFCEAWRGDDEIEDDVQFNWVLCAVEPHSGFPEWVPHAPDQVACTLPYRQPRLPMSARIIARSARSSAGKSTSRHSVSEAASTAFAVTFTSPGIPTKRALAASIPSKSAIPNPTTKCAVTTTTANVAAVVFIFRVVYTRKHKRYKIKQV